MDKYIGKLLDNRYEVLEVAGKGGMATIYKARCRVLNRFVAIKILKDEFALDEEFRRRFYMESQAVAKLSHNNIVAVYDVSHTEGLEYIVMELIEGITLKEYMQKKGPLSWQETLFFAQQISRALSHAHSRGIIHQDIKPQNILLLSDGTAKVTDFGIASFATPNQDTRVVQEAIGSVHYISPEQAKGSTIDYRTDIYSLGVVMYEMLTGKLPFEGDNALAIVMQHINALPLMPSEVIADIPKGMDDIVMHAMCPSVSRRYRSSEELYHDLQQLKQDADTEFRYDTEEGRSEKPSLDETQNLPTFSSTAIKQQQNQSVQQSRTKAPAPQPRKKQQNLFMRLISSPGVLATIVVLAFAAGAVVLAVNMLFGDAGDRVEVPNFLGMHMDEIEDNPEYSAFDISFAEPIADENYLTGQIARQSVNAGRRVSPGEKIVLTPANGTTEPIDDDSPYEVENFEGRSLTYAERRLNSRDILYDTQQEESDDIPAGSIIRTDPAAGTVLGEDDVLVLYVSTGSGEAEKVAMPDVVNGNFTYERAEQELKKSSYQFVVSKETVDSAEPEGIVVGQSIEPWQEVEKGSKITLYVSNGKAPEEPNTEPEPDPDGGSGSVETGAEAPTVTAPVPSTKSLTVTIPSDAGESVSVRVELDDGTVPYNSTHTGAAGSSINVSITSSGSRLATVYINGQKTYEEPINFN